MNAPDAASIEQPILRARAEGRVSVDESFEQLYAAYGRIVLGWMRMRTTTDAADLAQDVWTVFYPRWQRWQLLPEMMVPEARPILSFLYRTTHLVWMGHRRRAFQHYESAGLDQAGDPPAPRSTERLNEHVEMGRCLDLAREICPPDELDVLMAKLAGVHAREIARTLGVSEPVVDHRFRNAIARLQKRMAPPVRQGTTREGNE